MTSFSANWNAKVKLALRKIDSLKHDYRALAEPKKIQTELEEIEKELNEVVTEMEIKIQERTHIT